ncbi:MAG: SH3 domain-containing protein [Planctomycetales bacterium]|nr:SH3 domain-containing protein [Planctomycetales bacterium]
MRHAHSWLILIVWLAQTGVTATGFAADDHTFPYEAVVEANDVSVRSGPGPKYYSTGKLKRGDRVTVIRHDLGGWYVIKPPAGSFSWIPDQNVKRSTVDPDRGTVVNTTNKPVSVRVGSATGNDIGVEQRKLSPGDEVEILGERLLPGEKGPPQKWLQITPPLREYRWITGQSVVALSQMAKAVSVASLEHPEPRRLITPEVKSNAVIHVSGEYDEPRPVPKPAAKTPAKSKSTKRGAGDAWLLDGLTPEQLAAERAALDELECRYLAIKEQPSEKWNFGTLPDEYLGLRDDVRHPAIQRRIELRLRDIASDERFRDTNADFVRITSTAAQREAQLAAMQERLEQAARAANPVFDGAGIVQLTTDSTPQAPRYVLLGLDGKVLAHLHPEPGIDIAPWVGLEAGVRGQRSHHAELLTDVIQVRVLTAVKLRR